MKWLHILICSGLIQIIKTQEYSYEALSISNLDAIPSDTKLLADGIIYFEDPTVLINESEYCLRFNLINSKENSTLKYSCIINCANENHFIEDVVPVDDIFGSNNCPMKEILLNVHKNNENFEIIIGG